MNSNKVKSITFTGMMAALVFLATWMLHVPAGLFGGYIHFGDALVYSAAVLLPMPLAMLAAAIGAGLADLFSGAAIWILPTVIIKSLCCLPFTSNNDKLLGKRNVFATFISGLITIAGYFAATVIIFVMSESAGVAFSEAVILGFAAAAAEIPGSVIQAAGSAACFIVIAAALDKTKLKSSIGLKEVK